MAERLALIEGDLKKGLKVHPSEIDRALQEFRVDCKGLLLGELVSKLMAAFSNKIYKGDSLSKVGYDDLTRLKAKKRSEGDLHEESRIAIQMVNAD